MFAIVCNMMLRRIVWYCMILDGRQAVTGVCVRFVCYVAQKKYVSISVLVFTGEACNRTFFQ